MPPRKRGAAASKAAAGGKRAKKAAKQDVDAATAPATVHDAMQKLKESDKNKVRKHKPDAMCPMADQCTVHEDYDCMLNQTNITQNNNKYYVIQVLKDQNGQFYAWFRWGRVGETGTNSLQKFGNNADAAITAFKKKFKDKTRNTWEAKFNFAPMPGKYTLLEMDDDDDDAGGVDHNEDVNKSSKTEERKKKTVQCTLDNPTADLIKLIFNNDMFVDAMKDMEIDIKKMPLGKLSKVQIAKGFEVLEEMENIIKNHKGVGNLSELSSRFYTLIPHDFGRQRPPVISTAEAVRKKMDMLLVLADIELAQAMQKEKGSSKDEAELRHPLDNKYDLLQADLTLLDKKSDEFKIIQKYIAATASSWKKPTILDIWKVNRHNEDDRFKAHDKVGNRKLLWHGTGVAVVAAILKSGLRIMPHSGGRVGKGIYFASENGKSASYVSCASGGIGIMFLNEVALGKEKHITKDDYKLTTAPEGYDSIVAKGRTEPDPKHDVTINIDGHSVTVPQGKPINMPQYKDSLFSQSEYLIYKESQNRIRYLLKLKF